QLAEGYLALLAKIKTRAKDLPIDAAIHPVLARMHLPDRGNVLAQTIRHVSSVSIMAYRDTAEATLGWAASTIAILQSHGVAWRTGVLVHESSEANISFSRYSADDFLIETSKLDTALRARYGDALYRGLAFEDYAGLGTVLAKQGQAQP